MMEKITTKEITTTETTHYFYCDGCSKELGHSSEYEDGYYSQIGKFEHHVYIGHRYTFTKHFCPECEQEFVVKLQRILLKLGYKED